MRIYLWNKDNALANTGTEYDETRFQRVQHCGLVFRQHVHQRDAEYADDNHVIDAQANVLGVVELRNGNSACLPG